jgi:hypothetical protein
VIANDYERKTKFPNEKNGHDIRSKGNRYVTNVKRRPNPDAWIKKTRLSQFRTAAKDAKRQRLHPPRRPMANTKNYATFDAHGFIPISNEFGNYKADPVEQERIERLRNRAVDTLSEFKQLAQSIAVKQQLGQLFRSELTIGKNFVEKLGQAFNGNRSEYARFRHSRQSQWEVIGLGTVILSPTKEPVLAGELLKVMLENDQLLVNLQDFEYGASKDRRGIIDQSQMQQWGNRQDENECRILHLFQYGSSWTADDFRCAIDESRALGGSLAWNMNGYISGLMDCDLPELTDEFDNGAWEDLELSSLNLMNALWEEDIQEWADGILT